MDTANLVEEGLNADDLVSRVEVGKKGSVHSCVSEGESSVSEMRDATNAKEQQRTLVRSGRYKDLGLGVDPVGKMSELLGIVRGDRIS